MLHTSVKTVVTRWLSGIKRCTRKTRIFEAGGGLRAKSVLKWRAFVRNILNVKTAKMLCRSVTFRVKGECHDKCEKCLLKRREISSWLVLSIFANTTKRKLLWKRKILLSVLQIFWIVQAGRSEVAPASDVCGTGTDSAREEMLPYEQGVGLWPVLLLFLFILLLHRFCVLL